MLHSHVVVDIVPNYNVALFSLNPLPFFHTKFFCVKKLRNVQFSLAILQGSAIFLLAQINGLPLPCKNDDLQFLNDVRNVYTLYI